MSPGNSTLARVPSFYAYFAHFPTKNDSEIWQAADERVAEGTGGLQIIRNDLPGENLLVLSQNFRAPFRSTRHFTQGRSGGFHAMVVLARET
jgi:hypothetical protein